MTDKKEERILFVCNMGIHRSPSAAKIWNDAYGDPTDSMGIYNPIQDQEKLLAWATRVVVMEPHHQKWIGENFPKEYFRLDPICLDIPDIYGYMKPQLIEILKKKFEEIDNRIK